MKPVPFLNTRRTSAQALILVCTLQSPAFAATVSTGDLADLPFERLLGTEINTAAKIARQISDAPSAVAIVTAQEIKAYGYRTLADVLEGMRGLYITRDNAYAYLGGRGFGQPGDYAGRIMLLIDGYRTGDNIYGQILLGNDGILDTDLIERVEYVPGSGSVSYGNGAFFGIINIVTRQGKDFDGAHATLGLASHQEKRGGLTWGKRLDNGADLLLSASLYGNHNDTFLLYDPDDGRPPHGKDNGIGNERNHRLFFKGQMAHWTVEAAHVSRHLERRHHDYFHCSTPAECSQEHNEINPLSDDYGFASLHQDTDLANGIKLSTQVYFGQYRFNLPYQEISTDESYSYEKLTSSTGRWWGIDTKAAADWSEHQRIIVGGELRNDDQQNITKLEQGNTLTTKQVTAQTANFTYSLYLQDEIVLRSDLLLNIGLRYDRSSAFGNGTSPRIALIHQPWQGTTLKLSHGHAFRFETPQEQFIDREVRGSSRRLGPEKITSTELALEQRIDRQTQLTGSLYHYDAHDMIPGNIGGPLYPHQTLEINTTGAELAIEKHWDDGMRLKASYSGQVAHDSDGKRLTNSPYHLAKLQASTPLLGNALRGSMEVLYTGYTVDRLEKPVAGHTLTHLTFTSDRLIPHVELSAGIRNLFDQTYEVVAPQIYTRSITTIPQNDGRTWWMQMRYELK